MHRDLITRVFGCLTKRNGSYDYASSGTCISEPAASNTSRCHVKFVGLNNGRGSLSLGERGEGMDNKGCYCSAISLEKYGLHR